jgi:hypothetical protein
MITKVIIVHAALLWDHLNEECCRCYVDRFFKELNENDLLQIKIWILNSVMAMVISVCYQFVLKPMVRDEKK